MKKEFNFNKDESKEYQEDWSNLKVGDIVFSDSVVGFCSGGILYGCGERVCSINETTINTIGEYGRREKWDRVTRFEKRKIPTYYLAAFQSR